MKQDSLTQAFEAIAAELHTINDFVRWGASEFNRASVFFGHGMDNAVDEALALVCHAVELDHNIPPEFYQARLTHAEKYAIYALLRRRIKERIPLAYLTHEAWFAGLCFYVDERVLIPRSPVAELIKQHFEPWVDPARVQRVLDIGTGSGCIAIACAEAFPDALVDAADNSRQAISVAKQNVERHGLGGRVKLHETDVFDALPPAHYDLIVSNPPYVPVDELAALPPEYRHEPRRGLAGGRDGLDFAARIVTEASEHLSEKGVLVLEVGAGRAALEARFPKLALTWLDFEYGGEGICLISTAELKAGLRTAG